jgi:hypothetical protein
MDAESGLAILVATAVIIVAVCLGLVCYFMLKEKLTERK